MLVDPTSAENLLRDKMKDTISRDVHDTDEDRLAELPEKTSMERNAKLNTSDELPETSDGDGVSTDEDQRGSDEQSETIDNRTLGEDRQLYAALQRLLKCTVCYEPRPDSNQCKNGHLICRLCTTRLERNATAAAKAQCPTCRITLHPGLSRCLLAQQLASELPAPCRFCGQYFRQLELSRHECMECKMRPVKCRYNLFGCSWRGHWIDVQKHYEVCFYPRKKVHEIEPIVTEYITRKTKPVQDLKQAWKELLGNLVDKPRGMVMNLKEICLRKKLKEIGSSEMSLDDLCFTGSTNALAQFGSPITSIDVSFDSEERKVHYRIKFSGGLTPSFRFRLISFHIGGTKVEVLDHLHAPNTVPNTESQRFSCNLMLAEKQDLLLPSKRLLEKSDIDNEYASAKVDMLILYDLNRCSLRITPVEVHEWTPVCAATTQPLCGSGVRQGNYGVQESSTNLVNHHTGSDNPPMTDLQPTSLSHVLDRGSLSGTRPSSNWRSTIGRENLTTADSLLLDLSTRGVDNDETSTFVTTARPQETRHEVIQQNLFNADMFATLSNNNALQEEDYEVDSESCEHGSGLRDVVPTRRSGTRRSARTEELNSNGISHREQQQDCELEKLSDTNMNRHNATRRRTARRSATPTIPTPRRQGQQRRRLKLVLLHSGTQTLGSKINRRWLEPRIIRNAPSAETNMSASAEPEPQLSPTLAARLIAGLQRMAPYLSRMHMSSNLQVISRRPRRPGRSKGSIRGTKGHSTGLRYARYLGRKHGSIGRRSRAARRGIQATSRLEPPKNRWFKLNAMAFTQPLVSFMTSVKERGWQIMSWTRRSPAPENSSALDNSNGEVANEGTRADVGKRLDNILAAAGSGALIPSECDSIELAQRAFRTDPMTEIARISQIIFDVMELLRLPEAMSNAPYSQQLACQFAGEADKINKHLKAFSSACTRVCMAQDALSEAYIQLSEVARMISNQDSMVQAKNSDFEQTGLQFSSFLEELSVLHQRFSDELRSSMFTPAHKLPSQPNLQLTGSNPETIIRFSSTSDTQRNYDSCEHEMEVALKNYMKLSKRCTPKQHDDTVQELSKRRWLFKRAAVIYHARLNAAHFERDLVPLAAFHGFLTSLRLHTERVSQMTTLQSMTEFCETIKSQQDCRQVQATEATADFLNTLSRIECHPLEVFAPEPLLAKTDNTYLRSPNTKLLKKSGYLYLRTRKAFITDWIEVFCFTQGGNLLCQSKSELAASVLVNLNGKGVFAEPVDCDDRRYTFHIVSATEKRTVILQAENSTDRDEWIATLSNVIIATNGWSAKELAEAADGGSPSKQPPQMIADSRLSMDLLSAEEADLQTALRLSMSCQAWVSQSPPPALLNLLSVMSGNCKDSVSATNFETSFQLKFVGALQLAEHLNDPSSLNEASDYIIAQLAAQTPQSCIARLSNTAVWLFDAPIGEDAGLQQQLAYFPLAQITSCLTSSKDGRHVIFLISPPHSETDNGLPPGDLPWCLTFETDSPNEISECVLAAQLNRVTSLTEASDLAEKSKLVAIISRSSNFGDAPRLDSQSARTPASGFDQNLGILPPGASSPPTHVVPKPAGTAADDSAAAAASPPSSAEATQQQPSTPAAAAGELPVTPSSEQKSDLTDAVAAPCQPDEDERQPRATHADATSAAPAAGHDRGSDYQAEKEPSTVE